VPANIGATPVGMVPGPDGNLWFVLLGNASGGQGRFGRILKCGHIDWFQIKTGAAAGASLLHLGFLPGDELERIFLLGSSIASASALNAVFEVGMSGGYSKIESQQTIALPTQRCWAHRVLPTRHGVYVTELNTCALAHLSPGFSPYGEGINEASDAYALWGLGVQRQRVDY
jgi:virginiamycin B lyase